MRVEHRCKTCPTILRYQQHTNRKVYCESCKVVAVRISNQISLRMRRARYGRMSIRQYKALEAQS